MVSPRSLHGRLVLSLCCWQRFVERHHRASGRAPRARFLVLETAGIWGSMQFTLPPIYNTTGQRVILQAATPVIVVLIRAGSTWASGCSACSGRRHRLGGRRLWSSPRPYALLRARRAASGGFITCCRSPAGRSIRCTASACSPRYSPLSRRRRVHPGHDADPADRAITAPLFPAPRLASLTAWVRSSSIRGFSARSRTSGGTKPCWWSAESGRDLHESPADRRDSAAALTRRAHRRLACRRHALRAPGVGLRRVSTRRTHPTNPTGPRTPPTCETGLITKPGMPKRKTRPRSEEEVGPLVPPALEECDRRAGDGADRAPTRPGPVRCGLGRELLISERILSGSGTPLWPYRSMTGSSPAFHDETSRAVGVPIGPVAP